MLIAENGNLKLFELDILHGFFISNISIQQQVAYCFIQY